MPWNISMVNEKTSLKRAFVHGSAQFPQGFCSYRMTPQHTIYVHAQCQRRKKCVLYLGRWNIRVWILGCVQKTLSDEKLRCFQSKQLHSNVNVLCLFSVVWISVSRTPVQQRLCGMYGNMTWYNTESFAVNTREINSCIVSVSVVSVIAMVTWRATMASWKKQIPSAFNVHILKL